MNRLWLSLALLLPASALAEEKLPPAPAYHFNDYAHAVSPGTAEQLDAELAQFERQTSNQLVVAIYPSLQTDSSLEDYTQRITDAWHVGQKGKDNGAVLFAFMAEHRLRIQTNYGLESSLPDALCKRILDEDVAPRLRAGDADGAFTAGVEAMIAATKGEYQGTGQTVHDRQAQRQRTSGNFGIFVFFLILVIWSMIRSRRHVVYGRGGRGGFWGGGGPWIFPGGGWGGGGGGGSWGGGGFSGGGGSGGGGGASGSW